MPTFYSEGSVRTALRRPLHPKRRLASRSCFFEGLLLRSWASPVPFDVSSSFEDRPMAVVGGAGWPSIMRCRTVYSPWL